MFARKFKLSISVGYSGFYKFVSVSLCLLLLWNAAVFPAIITGTMIKTSQGMVPIEALVVGNRVLGLEKESLVEAEIINIKEEDKQPVVRIKIDKETLLVGKDHLFYDSSIDDWVKAKNLTDRSFIVDCDKNKHQCLGVESLDQEAKAYEGSLKKPNTFFIYKSQILVHNVGPAIPAAIFNSGGFSGGAPGGATSGGAGWLGVCFFVGSIVFSWLKDSGKLVKLKDTAKGVIGTCKFVATPLIKFVKKIGANAVVRFRLKAATVCALAAACTANSGKSGNKANSGTTNVSAAKSGSSSTQSNKCSPVKYCRRCRNNNKRKNNNAKKQKKEKVKNNGGAQSESTPPGNNNRNNKNNREGKKDRALNNVTKTEFLHRPDIKKDYKFLRKSSRGEIYQRRPGRPGLNKDAEYVYWDYDHNDVEIFNASKKHMGSWDAIRNLMYKLGIIGRPFPK
ncbi:MAG: hypothetical protein UR12_C0007G0019 [candidate division TM6 bacterium GW2011_GWF2_30_66]|nr:MAG: hypothetical protein UR12_C0007G0019 [candidate division TM6 bacterium GW2011_GWF2_30_66]